MTITYAVRAPECMYYLILQSIKVSAAPGIENCPDCFPIEIGQINCIIDGIYISPVKGNKELMLR